MTYSGEGGVVTVIMNMSLQLYMNGFYHGAFLTIKLANSKCQTTSDIRCLYVHYSHSTSAGLCRVASFIPRFSRERRMRTW